MNKVEVELSCKDRIRVDPRSPRCKPGESAYCRFHGYQAVVKIEWLEYRVVCCDCVYGRWEGQSEKNAKVTVRNHNYFKKHRSFYVRERVTHRGGSSRKYLISEFLKALDEYDKVEIQSEPPPF